MHQPDAIALLMAFSATLSACTPERQGTRSSVAVIRSGADAWDADDAWHVEAEPYLAIGTADGEAAYQFYRVYGALRLEGGDFVVSNAGSGEIRYFDETGRFLRAFGRPGQGPGEFAEFSSLRMCLVQDQLIVEDGAAGRFHVFSDSGTLIQTAVLTGGTGRPGILGCFGDGSLLTVMGGQSLQGNPSDIIRLQTSYHRFDSTGQYANPLAELPSRPRYVNEVEGRTHYPFIPFTGEPLAAAAANHFYAADGAGAVIKKYDLRGNPVLELHWSPGSRERADAVWDRYKRETLESMESERDLRMYTRFYEQPLPLPNRVPVAQSLRVDRQGHLWIERYRLPWDSVPRWTVSDSAGVQLGDVTMPRDLRVLDIGRDYVLGRHLDELNVERIHAHRLVKPAKL